MRSLVRPEGARTDKEKPRPGGTGCFSYPSLRSILPDFKVVRNEDSVFHIEMENQCGILQHVTVSMLLH